MWNVTKILRFFEEMLAQLDIAVCRVVLCLQGMANSSEWSRRCLHTFTSPRPLRWTLCGNTAALRRIIYKSYCTADLSLPKPPKCTCGYAPNWGWMVLLEWAKFRLGRRRPHTTTRIRTYDAAAHGRLFCCPSRY